MSLLIASGVTACIKIPNGKTWGIFWKESYGR